MRSSMGLLSVSAMVTGRPSGVIAPRPRRSRRARPARSPPPAPRCPAAYGRGAAVVVRPGVQDRLDPAPGLLLLVAAHEQVEPAGDHVEQQALVGADALGGEAPCRSRGRANTGASVSLLAPAPLAGQQVQLEAVFGLQLDHQLVGAVAAREDRVRRRPEVDDDLRVARRQALAGAQVERHAGPAPVLHLGAQRDEGLGAAAGAAPCPPRGSPAPRLPSTVPARYWPRTTSRPTLSGVNGLSERSTLSFSSRIASASLRRRRLHRDHRQQLQRVVLDHVAQRAGAGRRSRRACRRRWSSASVIWMLAMLSRRQSGSNSALPKRSAIRFCTDGLPR